MELEQYERIAESILFAGGESVDQKVLAEAMELDEEATVSVLESLRTKYDKIGSSLEILHLDTQWQFCTKKEFEQYIRGAFEIKRNTPLSQAALEVLAVVAYNQPVTKAFIEQVRGVDSSGVVSTLLEKGLIEEAGRLDLPGKPISYRTTPAFLRSFSMESLEELPPVIDEAETQDKKPEQEQQSLFESEEENGE